MKYTKEDIILVGLMALAFGLVVVGAAYGAHLDPSWRLW